MTRRGFLEEAASLGASKELWEWAEHAHKWGEASQMAGAKA